MWVHGSKSVKKDSVKKHVKSEVHTKALDFELKTELNPVVYNERVIKNTLTPKNFGGTNFGFFSVRILIRPKF